MATTTDVSARPRTATDEALADAISSWLRAELSGDEELVERMTRMAMSFRADGASMDETCAWTRSLVRSWLSHPSNRGSRAHLRLVAAS